MAVSTRLLGSNGQYSRYPLAFFLDEMRRLGLRSLDFVPQVPHFFCGYRDHDDPAGLKAALARAGLRVAVLTPPSYRCSITAPAGEQRAATLGYYKSCIQLAAELGCDRLVLDAAGACWDLKVEQLREHAADTPCILCDAAEAAGVGLLLAPAMGAETPLIAEAPVLNTARELEAMLHRLRRPGLGVCLDTNVMSACGDTIPDWFDRLGDRTGLVRLCDGNYHGWRAWGEGVLPMERYLCQLNEVGYGGEISLRLPGEWYLERPSYPDERALAALCGEV